MKQIKTKYSIDELVTIGDDIHNSIASFIVAKNSGEEKQKITFAVHGSREDVVEMLYKIFVKNSYCEDIMIDAIILSQAEKIKEDVFDQKNIK
jgi:hypothetical protein